MLFTCTSLYIAIINVYDPDLILLVHITVSYWPSRDDKVIILPTHTFFISGTFRS